jgi:hypothetical protein
MTPEALYSVVLVAVLAYLVYAFSLDLRLRVLWSTIVLAYLKLENRYLRWRIARVNRTRARLEAEVDAERRAQEERDATP